MIARIHLCSAILISLAVNFCAQASDVPDHSTTPGIARRGLTGTTGFLTVNSEPSNALVTVSDSQRHAPCSLISAEFPSPSAFPPRPGMKMKFFMSGAHEIALRGRSLSPTSRMLSSQPFAAR
jgi:hypothetical protein